MFKINFKLIYCGLSIAILSGCANGIRPFTFTSTKKTIETPDTVYCETIEKPEEKVKLQIIRQFMETGKLHAALAHLDATGLNSPRETYLRAEILRKTGRSELAIPYYRELIRGCAAGSAYHGLGLIAGRAGQIDEALRYLSEARKKLPTDVRVRNDLGYALLLDQQFEAARYEFLTALELDEDNEFSASNLVLLLLITDQPQKAQSLAVRMKLSGESFKELVAKARDLRISSPLPNGPEDSVTKGSEDNSTVVETAEHPQSPGPALYEEKLESGVSTGKDEVAETTDEEAVIMAHTQIPTPVNSHPSPDLPEEVSQ